MEEQEKAEIALEYLVKKIFSRPGVVEEKGKEIAGNIYNFFTSPDIQSIYDGLRHMTKEHGYVNIGDPERKEEVESLISHNVKPEKQDEFYHFLDIAKYRKPKERTKSLKNILALIFGMIGIIFLAFSVAGITGKGIIDITGPATGFRNNICNISMVCIGILSLLLAFFLSRK